MADYTRGRSDIHAPSGKANRLEERYTDSQLAKNAEKLIEHSKNGGQALRDLVNSVCTTGSTERKNLFAHVLDFMGENNIEQLTLILNTLSLKELDGLETMFKDSNYDRFAELKREIILAGRATELIERSKNGGQALRDLVNSVCTTSSTEGKNLFAHVLDFMWKTNGGQLQESILNTLSLKELGVLDLMLKNSAYDEFITLRRLVELAWNAAKLLEYSTNGGQKLLKFSNQAQELASPINLPFLYTLHVKDHASLMEILKGVRNNRELSLRLVAEINRSQFGTPEYRHFRELVENIVDINHWDNTLMRRVGRRPIQ